MRGSIPQYSHPRLGISVRIIPRTAIILNLNLRTTLLDSFHKASFDYGSVGGYGVVYIKAQTWLRGVIEKLSRRTKRRKRRQRRKREKY